MTGSVAAAAVVVIVGNFIEGIDLLERSEATFEVVDNGPRHEGLGTVSADAGAPVYVMIDEGLFVVRICKVRFLSEVSK